jgi:hypothetical protein
MFGMTIELRRHLRANNTTEDLDFGSFLETEANEGFDRNDNEGSFLGE